MAALPMNTLGMKDAEERAVQLAAYMQTANPTSPNFNPHTGYDTTAESLGYDLVGENLAWATSDPSYIVGAVWQDSLHIAAMLSTSANVMGVSCVYENGWPYWTYDPGISSTSSTGSPSPTPNPTPTPTPNPSPTALDSQEQAFLNLINDYRSQNGIGPLQVSVTLQAASEWMSNDMATNNYLSHTDSLGRSTQSRLDAFGYTYSPWGENLLGGDSDAQSAFNDWVSACDPDSTGACTYEHRANMLNGSYVAIGIARAYNANSDYGWYWATDFGGYLDQLMPTSGASAPVIASFVASPATITAGSSTTLSWSVSGANTISIDNGVGTISGATSVNVAPASTTTYHLTATNGSGTVTASATVTVNQPVQQTQPPSAPTLVSATAKSATDVSLTWTASQASSGTILGYDVIRNSVLLTQVTGSTLAYSDTTVSPGTTYKYAVEAFDSNGNSSSSSNVLSVTTPSPSSGSGSGSGTGSPGPCPAPATSAFTGCYYSNVLWAGNAAMTRSDSQINFNWTTAAPSPSIPASGFSVEWSGKFNFPAGDYVFTLTATGQIELYVDGAEVGGLPQQVDKTEYLGIALTAGQHLVTVKYANSIGDALATVSWAQSSN